MPKSNHTTATLTAFARRVVERAKQELKIKQPYYRYHIKWRKGKPVSVIRKRAYKIIDHTGALHDSINYVVEQRRGAVGVEFRMEEYGEWVDKGREPGKGVPPETILDWVRTKPIRLRNEQGAFVKATEKGRRTLAFLINRKIKHLGIDATNFFTEPFDATYAEYKPKIVQAIKDDIYDDVTRSAKRNSVRK